MKQFAWVFSPNAIATNPPMIAFANEIMKYPGLNTGSGWRKPPVTIRFNRMISGAAAPIIPQTNLPVETVGASQSTRGVATWTDKR